MPISTHALREEGDLDVAYLLDLLSNFYPRPPRGGRRWDTGEAGEILEISTHALREEGDDRVVFVVFRLKQISTHALREEGDRVVFVVFRLKQISTHALREEGDGPACPPQHPAGNFYPRPPRGGRPGVDHIK